MGNIVITCLLIYIFSFLDTRWCSCKVASPNNSTLRCKPSERAALLSFKHNLTYFNKDVSSSWEGEECCEWRRVGCDVNTGHILKLGLNGDESFDLLKMDKLESLVFLHALKQLKSLDLSFNDFGYSSIPKFIGSMRQLRYLNLSSTSLGGLVPSELGNLTNLRVLDISYNMLSGEIPTSLGKLSQLKALDLSYNNLNSVVSSLMFPSNLEILFVSNNQLSGKLLTLIGKLSKLRKLDISSNPLEGTVLSEPDFANLSSLTYLDMDDTMLTLNLSPDWVPPFQLQSFFADSCKINGRLPPWLKTQKHLSILILCNANISGLMPSWFHTMQQLDSVDLSNNHLSGSPIFPINCSAIILSSNSLSGEFLSNDIYHRAFEIDLSDNYIYGPLPKSLDHLLPKLEILYLSNNRIEGPIPSSLCQLRLLSILDIQNNSLTGEIPNCLSYVSSLFFVRLSHNKLNGHIPCFNSRDSDRLKLSDEFYLHLDNNNLTGEIPSCLTDITNLTVLDIGGNQLSGKMLNWFSAKKLRQLKILRLRDNNFSGTISRQICSLPKLQLMDFGHNHFTGSIPHCLSNLTGMTSPKTSQYFDITGVSEVFQGIERSYTSNLQYLVDIDLSYNNLSGSIPDDMTKLSGLMSLNLSYNQLSGTIPENIGGLKSLIALDLSKNKLEGSIPTSMGELYSLSHLNLSYNNLSGQIPTGNQLQTLSDQASIYAGNPYLCADFLLKKCKSKADKQDKGTSEEGNWDNKEKLGLKMVVMSGFATGFWGVVGCLAVNKRWRNAFFRRVEDGYHWLYDVVAVRVARAKINKR